MNCRTISPVIVSVFLLLFLLAVTPSAAADKIDVVESEAGFYYTIQKGDTLWDLSNHFNDSPWLWPELWEENDQISNPHWIFPGERIRLYQKSGAQVVSTHQPAPSSQPPAVVAPAISTPTVETPSPYFMYTAIDRIGFIRTPPVAPLGTIFEVQGRKVLISEGDMIYIRPTDSTADGVLIPGSRHTVFKYMKPTDAADSSETIGTQHYILGIVEVTQKEQDMVIAKVLKSFRTIRVDDLLMPFSPRHAKIVLKPSTPGIDGQIIISEDHSKLTGDYTLAFIDKGRADHIEVGQQYSIYNRQKLVLEDDQLSTKALPPLDIGNFLVLHTEQTTATVIVLNAANNIAPGERFRTPINP